MNRRGFFGLICAAPIAAIAANDTPAVPMRIEGQTVNIVIENEVVGQAVFKAIQQNYTAKASLRYSLSRDWR